MSDASESQQPAMWAEGELRREPQPLPSQPEPEREPRLKPVNRKQLLWQAVDVERLVGPDHLVRAIWELVGRLDLKGFTAEIAAVDGVAGRSAFDPRLLISLWLYADSEGVGSAHEVERRCAYPPAYQGLTGMEAVNYHPSADGSDFRVQYQEALDELFAQRLGVLSSEGLISLERVVHDGTKVKASASGNSFHREKTLRGHLEAARERVREMGDPRQEECSRRAAARERAAAQGGKAGTGPEGNGEGASRPRGAGGGLPELCVSPAVLSGGAGSEDRSQRECAGGGGVRGQDAHRSGARPLSLARSHGGVFESLAEDQTRAAAVWRARLAEGPLRGVVGLPHLQYSAMVPPALESSPDASPSLREKERRRGQGPHPKKGNRMSWP